jgi:outer membrane protein OmpA-like peptidoglycan-associated protein
LALPVTSATAESFSAGADFELGLTYRASWFLDLGLTGGYQVLTASASGASSAPGAAFRVGPTLRFRTDDANFWFPALELGAHYVNTGALSRFGVNAAVSVSFTLGTIFRLGPRVVYAHVFALQNELAFQTRDAGVLTFGAIFEWLPFGRMSEVEKAPVAAPEEHLVVSNDDPDGDGIRGAFDVCPNSPEDVDGVEDLDGCPEENPPVDADKDGVPDAQDKCPATVGNKDNAGCPQYRDVVVSQSNIETTQKIFFAFARATIMPKSLTLLQEVARAIKDAKLCVRVEAHTDNTGNAKANLLLSENRAAEVANSLADEGVKKSHLSSKGYGGILPIANNSTSVGRDANQRIEFVIVDCERGAKP